MEETINLIPESGETTLPITRENIVVNPGGTSDFNELENRPQYNSQEMTGETNIPAVPTKVSDLQNDSEFQTGSQVEGAISSAIASKQDILTAGTNISITDNTISATDTTYTAGANITIDSDNKISATDTTYSNFTGTDGQTAGAAGLVPAPATTDTDKFLKSDGTWDTAGGGSSVNVVQTTGTSTTDVMSQNATTSMIFDDSATQANIKIGNGATIGPNLTTNNQVSIGKNATIAGKGSDIAIGAYSSISNKANTRAIAIGGSVHMELDSPEGREMALADNATASVDLEWDEDKIREESEKWDIDVGGWGISLGEDFEQEEKTGDLDDETFLSSYYTKKQDIENIVFTESVTASDKVGELRDKIKGCQNPELKKILEKRLNDFVDFNFDYIADYYLSGATEEKKELLVDFGLVIPTEKEAFINKFLDLERQIVLG